jgi:hypothetical protein
MTNYRLHQRPSGLVACPLFAVVHIRPPFCGRLSAKSVCPSSAYIRPVRLFLVSVCPWLATVHHLRFAAIFVCLLRSSIRCSRLLRYISARINLFIQPISLYDLIYSVSTSTPRSNRLNFALAPLKLAQACSSSNPACLMLPVVCSVALCVYSILLIVRIWDAFIGRIVMIYWHGTLKSLSTLRGAISGSHFRHQR